MDERTLADAAENLHRTLTAEELDETLQRITKGAVASLPGVDYASITVRHADGRFESVAPTDAIAATLDARQYVLHEGPCYEAAQSSDQVVSADLAQDTRFPTYAADAGRAGIHAQAGLRLFSADGRSGALNLYSRVPGAFEGLTELADLFARQSENAAAHARELEAVRAAAREAELVGRAVGISMERYGLTQHAAFAFLTRLAERHDVEAPRAAQALIAASEFRAD